MGMLQLAVNNGISYHIFCDFSIRIAKCQMNLVYIIKHS